MDFSIISNTRCRLYVENANEPGIQGPNAFGVEKSSVIVASNKDIRKEAVMRTCISIEHGLDDNLPHGLSSYDHTSGKTSRTLRQRLRTPTSTEHQRILASTSSLGVLKRKKGGNVMNFLLCHQKTFSHITLCCLCIFASLSVSNSLLFFFLSHHDSLMTHPSYKAVTSKPINTWSMYL